MQTKSTSCGTAANRNTESILAFNYNIFDDYMLQSFFRELVATQPAKWDVIRAIFKGKDDVRLTVVDRYVDTPFRCQMLAHFCKQLQDELGFSYKHLNVMLTPIKEKADACKYGALIESDLNGDSPIKCPCLIPPNNQFEYTMHRDMYLEACAKYELDVPMKLKVRQNHVHCRDFNLSTDIYTLSIRSYGGLTGAWACRGMTDKGMSNEPSLNPIHREGLICANLHRTGRDKAGVFINIDLQVRR